ncbi:type II toxin-antitoxin system prevent-host-death family antitoxin [Longimicrobium sp.]|uniref:type II toxin-antitoxin system Phd/YefM family antitoxin n=1 Tax=Longimicrobium sp. TaxID=2029185 RepID=UPI002E325E6C|nr:type II toxin-antitoxin system prevent-host-death family antitoxin [Longimicrobium sp.]HEX6038518.1 type II toxin-antitoxin system prevent-host-death family antitoxin [Longimicrobium sp.]
MATQELAVESVLLSDLVEAAEHGTEVLLMKKGEPLARLVPVRRRKAGSARGLFTVPDDFDDPLDDFRDYM